jgi:anthranilate phosphoribosyltransferase
VLINAAAALAAYDGLRDDDLSKALFVGVERAAEAIDSGKAAATLRRWVEVSQAIRPTT